MISTNQTFMTACEASQHKQYIDKWLNEGKSCTYISDKLRELYNEQISAVSVNKYKKLRDDWIQKEIEKTPIYQAKTKEIENQFNDSVGKIKKVDVISRLSDIIDDAASYLEEAKKDETIKIRNMKDYSFVTGTLLDAVKLYGDTMLKAQRMGEIDKDPTLLKPTTINVNVKSALTDILNKSINTNGYELVDKLRGGNTDNIPQADEISGEYTDISDNKSGD